MNRSGLGVWPLPDVWPFPGVWPIAGATAPNVKPPANAAPLLRNPLRLEFMGFSFADKPTKKPLPTVGSIGHLTRYYFYIRDEVLGPFIVCVGSYLPFQTIYNLNGHHFIAGEVQRAGVPVRRDDNAFLATADVAALQAAAIGSVRRSSANASTTGPASWGRSFP